MVSEFLQLFLLTLFKNSTGIKEMYQILV